MIVPVRERVRVWGPLALALCVLDPLTLPDKLPELLQEGLTEGLLCAEEVEPGLLDGDAEPHMEKEAVPDGAAEIVEDGEGLAAPVPLATSEMDHVQVPVRVTRRDSLGDTVGEKEGLCEALGQGEALKEAPELDVPETECDGERLACAE